MKLPVIPFLIAVAILGGVVLLFNRSTPPDLRVLEAPKVNKISDIEGIETEVAIAPDGVRCAVVAEGDIWLLNLQDGSRSRLTQTAEAESFPAWSPDGKRLTFTRGSDTLSLTDGNLETFKAAATNLSWSGTGRQVYVRDRGLWLTDVAGRNDKQVVAPDPNPNITVHSPRFSPTSLDVAYIKSLLNLSAQVWTLDALRGNPRALVSDRPNEIPLDVAWIMGGRELVYLTNRSGSYSLWHVNFEENTLLPLTAPLQIPPFLAPVGMAVWNDRIVMPRHFLDSNITLSDGKTVVSSEDSEIEPAVSPDGKLVAYTRLKENKTEIWTAGIDGSNPAFRTDGHEPRFTPDGLHILYTSATLEGNDDIWRLDIRNGGTERITDADEMDAAADASSDGRTIAFASTRSFVPSIWSVAASGGKRLRLNDGGYAPRFSPDARTILYWNKGGFWLMDANGSNAREVALETSAMPVAALWAKGEPLRASGSALKGPNGAVVFHSATPLSSAFDVMPDGRFLIAPIQIRETSLWTIDLQYRTP